LTMVMKAGLDNVLYAPPPQLQFLTNELKGLEILSHVIQLVFSSWFSWIILAPTIYI
jgi:hypothetical protein